MGQPPKLEWLNRLRRHKALRQTTALFSKNVLVAWRNKWATAIRLLAPLLFLGLALITQKVMGINPRRMGRIRFTPFTTPAETSSIPSCYSELFIHDKPCIDFAYSPNNNEAVRAIVGAIQKHNNPPIPDDRVMGFSNRFQADEFIQGRSKYVLGAVHFVESANNQLQYIIQSNTSAPAFKGYVQSPNDFFQLPFMSAIAREISRYQLAAAGKAVEAAALQWQPSTAVFPHPQLSAGTAGYILPPFIFVACMFATISHLTALVGEKESGLRQALQTMGLLQGAYWLSWWLFEAVMAFIAAWVITGFGTALRLSVFVANDFRLLVVLFWLFGMAMSSFTCCVSVFVHTSQSASNTGLGIVLVGWVCQALAAYGLPYSPSILYTKNGMGKAFFWIFALFPWNPLTKGVLDMSAAASNAPGSGLRFEDRSSYCRYVPDPTKAASGDMSWLYQENNCIFSIEQCYWALLIQAVGWMIAAVYLDNVQPNKHGVRMPIWYPMLPGYWSSMCRITAAVACGQEPLGSCAGAAESSMVPNSKTRRAPFAVFDVNKQAAKVISGSKEESMVGYGSSTGTVLGVAKIAGSTGLATQTSMGTGHRHSVSSGFLRRRDNRHSSAGEQAAALAELGSSRLAATKLMQATQSQQLAIQPSATVLRLSESSSEAHSGLGVNGAAAPGATISLQQYQQLQQAKQATAAASNRWWEFWRVPESSAVTASKKHSGIMAAASGSSRALNCKDLAAGPASHAPFGMVPVVLDPGVLQEEQRMKAAWYSDPDGSWSPNQDLVQVFGLRKVYQMPSSRASSLWPFKRQTAHQREQQYLQRQQQQEGEEQKRRQRQPQQFVAVADSWFGVPKGQLMCLLGPNGAGKTTTLNCLIGALPPTGGDIQVMGHSLLAPGGLDTAQGVMGVCPQFDVLWDELTGSEHMYIYGCIKGLPSHEVSEHCMRLLEEVQLTAAGNKRSSSYSGGMKRRLSVALALLGQPQLIFLDEPSTGMDPISRRAVWDAINAAKQHAAIVLTTHSMEEADALGDRIGIMVRGRMRVLGGSLTLKQKYGNGYQLRMRLKDAIAQNANSASAAAAATQAPHGVGSHPSLSDARQQDHYTVQLQSAASGPSNRIYQATEPERVSSQQDSSNSTSSSSGTSILQVLVAEHLGLAPVEEGRQMVHYVIPQVLAPQLQVLLEVLDNSGTQQQLGLAEVHVSLASLEEVFLAVVKQAEQDHAALHGHTVLVELPNTGQQLEVPVGQEAAVDPATGEVYAVDWVQDEWGKLAVLNVRQMQQAEQQQYWQNRHVQQ